MRIFLLLSPFIIMIGTMGYVFYYSRKHRHGIDAESHKTNRVNILAFIIITGVISIGMCNELQVELGKKFVSEFKTKKIIEASDAPEYVHYSKGVSHYEDSPILPNTYIGNLISNLPYIIIAIGVFIFIFSKIILNTVNNKI